MKKKKNNKTKGIIPKDKMSLKDFLFSEEGKISKKSIAKLGISLAILSMTFKPEDSDACSHSSHNNSVNTFYGETAGDEGGHTSNSGLIGHSNHCSHSTGGWG